MTEHPYKSAPSHNFWRRGVVRLAIDEVDPVVDFPVRISPETKVATAGSCFAQHIARHLRNSGYNYYVAEEGHPILPEEIRSQNNYGLFSARYGNLYTSRQLLQLMERAYGSFAPVEDIWLAADGSVLDPFRPTAQPGGFVSELEMRLDRRQHLVAVRDMFETLDVFVFTLGLTECWASRQDGAVFPICPGVEGGAFSEEKHCFLNLTVEEVVSDLTKFLLLLARVNPKAEVILTVSPVPLAATAQPGQHVLTATTYSKSVLRVAAEMITTRFDHVGYFPSYEIITGSFNRGAYFADDLRNVLEEGVNHVMRLFLAHATRAGDPSVQLPAVPDHRATPRADALDALALAQKLVEVECDEANLDKS